MKAELAQLQLSLSRGNLVEAARLAQSLLRQYPESDQVLKAGVHVHVRMGQIDAAMKLTERLAKLEPHNLGYVNYLARWALQLRQEARAHDYYRAYLKNNDDDAKAWFQLCELLQSAGQSAAALDAVEKALSGDFSPRAHAQVTRAIVLADLRREGESVAVLRDVLNEDPGHVQALFNLGSLLQASGERTESEALFEQVLDQDPEFIEALVRMIHGRKMTVEQSDWIQRAERAVASQSRSDYELESLQFALAKARDDLGEYEMAMGHMRTANEKQRQRVGAWNQASFRQFVDASITRVTSAWLDHDQEQDQSSERPIFIVGHFRSGSTLIEQMLAASPETHALGELDLFLRLQSGPPQDWWALFDEGGEDRLSAVRRDYLELSRELGAHGARGVDKRPENLQAMGLIKRLFPKALFIHSRRRRLDNAISIFQQQLNDLSRFSTSLLDFSSYDKECDRLMDHWKALFGRSILTVNYESLVAAPEQTGRSLYDFLGLTWTPTALHPGQRGQFVRTASAAQLRQSIHSESVGRGKNYLRHLTQDEQEAIAS